jgi:hypothetical protein
VEYGDSFDTMGNASAGRRHFNTRYKNYLDWLPNTYVRNALTNGTYRVFAMDSTNEGFRVSFPVKAGRTYTVRYRNNLTSGGWTTLESTSNPVTVTADGTATVTDANAPNSARFYQVNVELSGN